MRVSFPLVRVCGILFHCMFPDVMPERKRKKNRKKRKEKNRKRQQKEKEKKKEKKRKGDKSVLGRGCDLSL